MDVLSCFCRKRISFSQRFPRLYSIYRAGDLALDIALRLYDTFSDYAVTIEFYLSGDFDWFLISLFILVTSSTRLAYVSIQQETKWEGSQKTWKSPSVLFEAFLGFFSLRPILLILKMLWVWKLDFNSPQAFRIVRILEEERFEEGLYETMLELFLQSYVFFIRLEKGNTDDISWIGISSIVISIICMTKTLLERFPSRTKALSYFNKFLLFIFVLAGVLSRCAVIIGVTLFVPWAFVFVMVIEVIFVLFLHSTQVKWHEISSFWFSRNSGGEKHLENRAARKNQVAPFGDLSDLDPDMGNSKNEPPSSIIMEAIKSTLLCIFVFCPVTVSKEISKINISMESVSILGILWFHSTLAVALVARQPTPFSVTLGILLGVCILVQLALFLFHNNLIHKITRLSSSFLKSIRLLKPPTSNSGQQSIKHSFGISTMFNTPSPSPPLPLSDMLSPRSLTYSASKAIIRSTTLQLPLSRPEDILNVVSNGLPNIPDRLPGEVDAAFVENDESMLMAVGYLEKAYADSEVLNELQKSIAIKRVHDLAVSLLERGADPFFEDSHGHSVFTVSRHEFQHSLVLRLIDMDKAPVKFDEDGSLVLTDKHAWMFIEDFITKGLRVNSFLDKCEGMTDPFLFSDSIRFDTSVQFQTSLMKKLFKCLKGSQSFEIFLREVTLDFELCKILGSSLLANNGCRKLTFKDCKFDEEGIFYLLKGIGLNKFLEEIDLTNCQLRNCHVEPFLKDIKGNKNLTKLILDDNLISDCDNDKVWPRVQQLIHSCPALRDLSFRHNKNITSAKTILAVRATLEQMGRVSSQHADGWVHFRGTPAKTEVEKQRLVDNVWDKVNQKISFAEDMSIAAKNGFVEVFEKVKGHFDINTVFRNGLTSLVVACVNRQHKLIKYLLDREALVEIDSVSALTRSLDQEEIDSEVVNLLLTSSSCFVHKQDLKLCLRQSDLSVFEYLLKHGDTSKITKHQWSRLLFHSVPSENTQFLTLLLSHEPIVNGRIVDDISNPTKLTGSSVAAALAGMRGFTPLLFACKNNHIPAAQILLQHGAKVNIADANGDTALHHVIRNHSSHDNHHCDFLPLCRSLVHHKNSDFLKPNKSGETPFSMAWTENKIEILQELVKTKKINLVELGSALTGAWENRERNPELRQNRETIKILVENKAIVSMDLIVSAIKERDREMIKLFVGAISNGDESDQTGQTPLCQACLNDDYHTAELLLTKCSANVRNGAHETPLIIATERKYSKLIQLLLQNNADPCLRNRAGKSPIYIACCDHLSVSLTRMLMEKSTNLTEFDLHAIFIEVLGHKETRLDLLSALLELCRCQKDLNFLLSEAVCDFDTSLIELVVKHGADLNSQVLDGETPLTYACTHGHLPLVDYLLSKKVNPDLPNSFETSPLQISVNNKNITCIQSLLRAGANPCLRISSSHHNDPHTLPNCIGAPIHTAVNLLRSVPLVALLAPFIPSQDHFESVLRMAWLDRKSSESFESRLDVISALLSSKLKSAGLCPDLLGEAVREQDFSAVELLLRHGADPNVDGSGGAPLCTACRLQSSEIVTLLLDHKDTLINVTNSDGDTPLHIILRIASVKQHDPTLDHIFDLLTSKGADPVFRNKEGETPLGISCECKLFRMAGVLMRLAKKKDAKIAGQMVSKIWGRRNSLGPEGIELLDELLDSMDVKSSTFLHDAIQDNNLPLVRTIIRKGANVDLRDSNGDVPLHRAVQSRNLELVSLLVEEGAKIMQLNRSNLTPLQLARKIDFAEARDWLLPRGSGSPTKMRSGLF